jgi:DNA-binding response OmpR family regulator
MPRVLIVDAIRICEMMAVLLSNDGFETDVAADG